jgi:hypothetical protein
MKKTTLCLSILLVSLQGFSQDSIVKKLTKFRFDIQAFGNSPVFSAGISKSILLGKKSLLEARLGAGFYLELRNNQYADGYYFTEKKELEPTYSVPLEFTYTPNYKKRFSFSTGVCYYTYSSLSIYADTQTFIHHNYRVPVHAIIFTTGSDYNFKNKLYLGLRLLTFYDFEKGFSKNIPFLILPNIRFKF